MFPSSECYAWIVVLMVESVAIVAVNFVTIVVFVKTRGLRRRSMYLVMNLAVADMFVGGFTELISFISTGASCNVWKYNELGNWLKIIYASELLFPVSSLTTMVAISLQQLHATFYPFRHRVLKNWVYGVTIAVVWLVAASVPAVRLFQITNYYCFWITFTAICLFVVCVAYTCMVMKLQCGTHPRHHGATNRERKLTMTLFIVTLVSLLVWLPYVISTFLYLTSESFRSLSKLTLLRLNYALIALYYANSLVNPILYAVRMREFRRALALLFRCQQLNQVQPFPLHVLPPE